MQFYFSGMQLLAFSRAQQNLIITLAVVLAVVLAANAVLLALFFYKRKKSRLSTEELQRQRDGLLEELNKLRSGAPIEKPVEQKAEEPAQEEKPAAEESADEDDEDEDDEDFDEEEDESEDGAEDESGIETMSVDTVPATGTEEAATQELLTGEILAVRNMSALMREKFGFVGDGYNRKQYYVRYSYGFEAKLRAASGEAKSYYARIMDTVRSYGKLKVTRSYRGERVYAGRKTLGLVLMRGKTLCVAFALDPADYENTKYRGRNVGDKKRFGKTPMLMRITSERKLKYAQYLIGVLAAENELAQTNENYKGTYRLGARSNKDLFAANAVKITVLGEAPDLTDDEPAGRNRLKILAVRDMSALMREKFGFAGEEYTDKSYYVRYSYGFEARLRSASEETKQYYSEVIAESGYYDKIKVARGFKNDRLYCGRKTVGIILLRGKTLCVALALDPADYENTKYRGTNVGDKRRFNKTPMLIKITSPRRLSYVKYLLGELAKANGAERAENPEERKYPLDILDRDGYYAAGLLKITVVAEVPAAKPAEEETAQADDNVAAEETVRPGSEVTAEQPTAEQAEEVASTGEVKQDVPGNNAGNEVTEDGNEVASGERSGEDGDEETSEE